MSPASDDIVEIYRAKNLPEAHAIRLFMESEGVAVSISNETLQGIVGETAMGWATSPRLLVTRSDLERAQKLLASHLAQARSRDPSLTEDALTCLACGAVMHGDLDCPACGWGYGDGQIEPAESTSSDLEPAVTLPVSADAPPLRPTADEGLLPVLAMNPILPVPAVWWELATVMCIGFVPHMATSLLPYDHSAEQPYFVDATQLLVSAFCSTFATLYIIHRSGERWQEFGIGKPRITDVILGLMLTVFVWYFGSIVYWNIADRLLPTETAYTLPVTRFDFALMLAMYVTSAMSEEVIMRSYLLTRLRHLLHRPWLGVLISSTLFALYHGYQGTAGLVHAWLFGLLFAAMFTVYPRLWPLVVCHAMHNIMLELHATR